MLTREVVFSIIHTAEIDSQLNLSLYGLLMEKGQTDLARIAWRTHANAGEVAELLGREVGIQVRID